MSLRKFLTCLIIISIHCVTWMDCKPQSSEFHGELGDSACSYHCSDIDIGEHCDEAEGVCKCGDSATCIGTDNPLCEKGVCNPCDRPNIMCPAKNENGVLKCLTKEYLCDGEWDCEDGEDEKNCVHANTEEKCFSDNTTSRFTCSDNEQCINYLYVCDGTEDCKDGSDEFVPGKCGEICADGLSEKFEPSSCDCQPQQSCITMKEEKCETTYEKQYYTEYESVCTTVYEEKLDDELCQMVPRQICRQVPKQLSRQVPKWVCHEEAKLQCTTYYCCP